MQPYDSTAGSAVVTGASARVGSGVPPEVGEQGARDVQRLLTLDPAEAAALLVTAVHRRRPRPLVGWSATAPDLLARALPGSHGRVLAAGTALAARGRR